MINWPTIKKDEFGSSIEDLSLSLSVSVGNLVLLLSFDRFVQFMRFELGTPVHRPRG